MRVHRGSFRDVPGIAGRHAVSLGTFDGVHRGHQAILGEVCAVASRAELDGAVVVTFGRHPRGVLSDRGAPPSITDLDERIALIGATGVDELVVLEFDEALSRIEYDEFVADLLVRRFHMAHFVLGHDVHFGRERRGNAISVAALAEASGFNLSQVASVRDGDVAISSTRIRQALAEGAMDDAVRWAGHPIPYSGIVETGRRIGHTLGFPTANVPLPEGKVVPALGVYAGWARHAEQWVPMVANLGRAPTVAEAGPVRLEAHLLDGAPELYGSRLELALATRLRPEQKFGSKSELEAAIARDCERARGWLADAPDAARPGRLSRLPVGPGPLDSPGVSD